MIYWPKGKAGEYAKLAANLYKGCGGRCGYCYVPKVTFQEKEEFHSETQPKKNALDSLRKDAARMCDLTEAAIYRVLLSFSTDPYQDCEAEYNITRGAIKILHEYGMRVAILTKNGMNALADFKLLGPNDLFGATLTFVNPADSQLWEPGAQLPEQRLKALELAHSNNIYTFASMEPVISPRQTLELIEKSAPFVDHFKVGKLNHEADLPDHLPRPNIDWRNFANEVISLLESLNKPYYIKHDLARFIDRHYGFSKGSIPL